MGDHAVEARLVPRVRVVALRLRGRAEKSQLVVRQHRARSPPDQLQPVGRAGRVAGRGHRADDRRGRALGRLEEDRGEGLARHVGEGAARAGAHDAQGAAEEPHRVEVVDQHLRDHQAGLPCHERLAEERRSPALSVGQEARGDRREPGEIDLAQHPAGDPPVERTIPGSEPPVLVDHQAHASAHPCHERLGLRQRRRERLLAEDVHASRGGRLHPGGVGLARRRDVERVELFLAEHRVGVRVDARDAELVCARPRAGRVRIRHRDDPGARAHVPPCGEVVPADHACAGERDAKRRGSRGACGCHLRLRSGRAGVGCPSLRRRPILGSASWQVNEGRRQIPARARRRPEPAGVGRACRDRARGGRRRAARGRPRRVRRGYCDSRLFLHDELYGVREAGSRPSGRSRGGEDPVAGSAAGRPDRQ